MNDSVVAVNCFGKGARLQHAMLGRDVQVESAAQLNPAIVTDRSVVGRVARIVRDIMNQGNYTPAWDVIDIDLESDCQRFDASAAAFVVVSRGRFPRVSA